MQDLTTGSVSRHLLKTTSFMLVSMIFQTLYALIDLYWVGRLGKEAVAAVAVSSNVMFIVLAVSQMLGVGITTLISHAAGRKDRDRALLVFNQAQVLSILVAVIFVMVAMALRPLYARELSADAETARLASEFLLWFLPAMGLQFGLVAMGAALRGIGLFKPGMVVQTATVIINMILAPFLIFGWGTGVALGVAGAAISTFISIAIGTVWIITYFLHQDSYLKFMLADWKPQYRLWADMLKIGLPAGAEFALMSVYLIVVMFLARPFGSAAQAGFGIGLRLIQSFFLPVIALGFAVAPVAGQNFGARMGDRVRDTFKAAAAMATVVMLVCVALAHIAPGFLIALFSPDPAVIAVGEEYLRIVSWTFIASGLVFVSSSMFQAMGNTVPPLMTSSVRIVVVTIPILLLSQRPDFALNWIWKLTVLSTALQMVMNLLLLRREFRRRLVFDPAPAPAGAVALT